MMTTNHRVLVRLFLQQKSHKRANCEFCYLDGVGKPHFHSFIHFNSGSKAHKNTQTTDRQIDRGEQKHKKTYKPKNYKQRIDRDKLHNKVLNRDLGKLTKMHNDMSFSSFSHY